MVDENGWIAWSILLSTGAELAVCFQIFFLIQKASKVVAHKFRQFTVIIIAILEFFHLTISFFQL